jgi:hypothetical protein
MQPPSEENIERVLRGHPSGKYPKLPTNVVKIYVCSTKSGRNDFISFTTNSFFLQALKLT